ncbi:DsbA family protein [Actibacterium sp. 188UL27-1]|uniref:DsbA family protein n=1 Tax=Actibacterium sp. 188UL27-1 TaxID=2786961 RepID=UPI0019597DE5|nr:DsbA family protein [Actibacterium sp. 188UL27-1]MBM7067505.1 thioredoxin domain-containing protein [Actibacterium sp. 188UL27-1]
MKALLLSTALVLAPLTAIALDLTNMTAAEKEAFGAQIREYLLENPQVLREAIAVLEQRQEAEQAEADQALVAANTADLYDDGYSWIGGNPEGDVTIVEFLDYSCGFCKRAHPEVTELVESDGNIRLIIKEFPILGEQSLIASRFAIAALQTEGPAAYKVANDKLITLEGEVNDAALREIADAAGMETEKVMDAMAAPEIDGVIAQNRALAQRLQINGTPTFVMGGQMIRGYLPLDGMRQIVAEARDTAN